MKLYLLFLVAILPCSVTAMEKEKRSFEEMYNAFKTPAMKELSKQEIFAISLSAYKADRETGVKALEKFAQYAVLFAYENIELSNKKFVKKSKKYADYMILLRDASVGLAKIEVVDEITAKVYVLNLLSDEEKKYLQEAGYRANKSKAEEVIQHFAQLTSDELEKKGLLKTSKEGYAKKFLEEKIKELDQLYE